MTKVEESVLPFGPPQISHTMIIFLEQFGINYRESEAPKEADLEENE
jgi:hypothetical protein